MSYLSKVLKKMESRSIFKKIATGVYFMNPEFFAKGAWKDIHKLRDRYINLNISYSKNGKILRATIESK